MNENEATKKVQETHIAPRQDVKRIIDGFLICLKQALKDGETVKIKDLGTFTPTMTKARKGRNPKTGEVIEIAPRKTIKFKPSPNFIKNILNGGN